MPPIIATIILALHLTAFTTLVGTIFMPGHALASPVALPLPWMAADYSRNGFTSGNGTQTYEKTNTTDTRHVAVNNRTQVVNRFPDTRTPPRSSLQVRDLAGGTPCSEAATRAEDMRKNGPSDNGSQDFASPYQACQSQVSSLLESDRGLDYYNGDEFQTLLKDLINATKELLDALDQASFLSILGIDCPLVYDIKCLLDKILDISEDLTDLTLDELDNLIAQTVDITLQVVGLVSVI